MEIVEGIDSSVSVSLQVQDEKHHHDAGMLHGGVILSMLDTAISRTLRTAFPDLVYAPTVNITVNFFRPVKTGTITASGRIINKSRSSCCIEGNLHDEAGKLIAQAVGNMHLNGNSQSTM